MGGRAGVLGTLVLCVALCSTAAGASARLATIHRLTGAEFAAIERVFVAALPLDKLGDDSKPSEIEAATSKAHNACLKLSTRDPLLRALRAGCPALSAFTEVNAEVGACSDAACLKRALGRARTALGKAVSGNRTSDRGVNATRLAAGCKRALVSPAASYVVYDKFDAAFAKLQDALTTGSADDLDAAEAALAAADKRADDLPTVKRSLQLLRAGCR
jgi:hypothetical protein